MFPALICPSPGVCDCIVELPQWPFRSGLLCVGVRVRFGLGGVQAAGT